MKHILKFFYFSLILLSCNNITERNVQYDVQGVDVSHYQGIINWQEVGKDNINFAYIKATEGEIFQDTNFCYNWMEIKKTNIVRGAYHFFHPKLSALQQAQNYIFAIEKLENGDLPPVLDVEVTDGASKEIIVNRMKSWLEIIELRLHQKPIIYTNLKFYYQYILGNFDEYKIWISRYNETAPQLVSKQWTFWQYGRNGQVKGISRPVDLNVFIGNTEAFDSLRFNTTVLSAL